MQKSMPSLLVRLLLNMYEKQQVCTEWNGVFSSLSFSVQNGVRQGGVLSPILFTLYMDVLLKRLESSGIGCHIGNHYTGAVAYADDLTLLCPSRMGLQKMLHICEDYGRDYNVSHNSKKTFCIVFNKTSVIKHVG